MADPADFEALARANHRRRAAPRIQTCGDDQLRLAVPNGRTTQIFINTRDNRATHDVEPFVPIGKVVEGMDVVDRLNSEYGRNVGRRNS